MSTVTINLDEHQAIVTFWTEPFQSPTAEFDAEFIFVEGEPEYTSIKNFFEALADDTPL